MLTRARIAAIAAGLATGISAIVVAGPPPADVAAHACILELHARVTEDDAPDDDFLGSDVVGSRGGTLVFDNDEALYEASYRRGAC